VLTGARSNYTISTSNGATLITEVGDPHHVGTLTVSDVQELVFNPSMDPSGNSGKLIEAFAGSTVDLLAPIPGGGEVVKVDSGATLESDITFSDATGTLRLDPQSTFTGHVIGFVEGDRIDLIGFDPNSTQASYSGDATGGTLTVIDATHTVANHSAAQILLTGNYLNSTFNTSDDLHGGVFVVDPPADSPTHALVASKPDSPIEATAANVVAAADLLRDGSLHFSESLLLANDDDASTGQSLSVASVQSADALDQLNAQLENGDVVLTANNGFTFPAPGASTSLGFGYTAADQTGAQASAHGAVTLEGGTQITGTSGHDIIIGTPGDTLTGMGGGDVFVFNFNAGNQTVNDFHLGQDVLDVSAFGFSQEQLQSMIDATNPGDHTLTLAPAETVTLQGVDVHQLQANHDFILSHGPGSA